MEWTEVEVVKGGLNGKAVEEHKQSDDKKVVNVKDLDVNQLKQIGKRVQQECQQLSGAINGLKRAGTNFFAAKTAVSDWKAAKKLGDLDIMLPFTDSLYLKAKIDVDAPLLIEIGSGTIMEKTEDQAMEFFDRRLNMVTGSMNKVGSELQQKSMANQAIGKEITDKVKQLSLYNKIYQ